MGSLLSAISGQFAKMLILGTMFPVIILSALNILLIAPLLPQTAFLPGLVQKIAVGEEKWPAVIFTLVVLVLTGLLYDLNIPIIRVYEGYPWQNTFIGHGLGYLQKLRLRKAQNLAGQLLEQPSDPDLDACQTTLNVFLGTELPDTEEWILPTRLGNVIRCFERYSSLAYGMDAIVFWPRLVAKIDSGFASTIDEAKTAFDFMLNLSFLSALTCLAAIGIGLAIPVPIEWHFFFPWLWRAGFFFFLSVVFYNLAINRALAWGVQVRAAFDLYRLDLLTALGYQQKPLSYQEERALWFKLSSQILYPDQRIDPLPYNGGPTRVIPYPTDITLTVRRALLKQEPNLWIPVQIGLTNPDTRQVVSLFVIDALPDGYAYVPDSATASSGGLAVRRLAPLELFLGPIAPGGVLTITYAIRPAATQGK
jgi:hypothetical protein